MTMTTLPSRPPRRKYASSSSFQMALLFTLLCGTAVVVMGYFSYYFQRGHFVYGTEQVIESEIQLLTLLDQNKALQEYLIKAEADESRVYAIFKSETEKPDYLPEEISLLAEGTILFEHIRRAKKYAARIHSFEDGRKLLVGVDITDVSKEFEFMQFLSLLSIALMIIVVIVSYMISRFVVDGTNNIAKTAYGIIATGDLTRRVDVRWHWDDLSNMAGVLNTLLDRIESLMQGVRRVSDNIAHDLRTPLTRLRHNLESLKSAETIKNDQESLDKIEDLLAEADHMLNTFNALLRIARIENEKQKSRFSNIDLSKIVEDVLDFYEPLIEERGLIYFKKLQSTPMYGDRDLLFQTLANLLDNAIKFTPSGGTISIATYSENGKAVLTLSDGGPGISVSEQTKIFDRFYRGETSRHTPGNGLGLSLVKAVIDLHEGVINLKSDANGLTVRLTF
ncbi:MAG: HAMP domain-containing histidine kinase [Alphaproteobacteria bacterium]|nr:HAMP domain-containing histidine kinase [Alphaproteobacteria bacterium]